MEQNTPPPIPPIPPASTPPPLPVPASPPPDKKEKWNRIGSRMNKIIAVVAIIIFAMIFFGRKLMMGTKYNVTSKETVNYSKKATESDAKKLGELLQTLKVFDGTKERDVLLSVDEKEGTVISFVFSGNKRMKRSWPHSARSEKPPSPRGLRNR
jgi:hypothetical protein